MQQIPEQQINQRWISLPQNLKEAVFSESNTDIVWHIGEENKLDEEHIKILATIVSDVIMGFLSLDDFNARIKNDLGLDAQVANSIGQEISTKIFEPIKDEIKKNYAPPAKTPAFIHPPDHPMPEPLPHEGEFSHLKYQDLRSGLPRTESQKSESLKVESSNETLDSSPPSKASSSAEATADRQNDAQEAKPFMLHQEESNFDTGQSETLTQMPRISISQFQGEELKTESKPVARVEIGQVAVQSLKFKVKSSRETSLDIQKPKNLETPTQRSGQAEIRLVHFSSFATPVGEWTNTGPKDPNPFRSHLDQRRPDNTHQLPPIIPRNIEQLRQRGLTVKPLVWSPRIVPPPVRHISENSNIQIPNSKQDVAENPQVEGNTLYV